MSDVDADAAAAASSKNALSAQAERALLQRIDKNPWDVGAWQAVINAADSMPLEKARKHYDTCLKLFPTSGRIASAYARRELADGNVQQAEAILQRYLLTSYEPQLWLFYIDLVQQTKYAPAQAAVLEAQGRNDLSALSAAQQAVTTHRQAVLAAFEFAAQHMGYAFQSGPFWDKYVRFMNEEMPTESSYQLGQARELRRRVYKRSTSCPHSHVDEHWADYQKFERDFSQAKLAESLITQQQAEHGTASAVYKERAAVWAKIDTKMLPAPPAFEQESVAPQRPGRSWRPTAGEEDEETDPWVAAAAALSEHRNKIAEQVAAWRRVLGYELSNPLQLPRDQHIEVVRLHFKQCLAGVGRYCPDMWHDFAVYESDISSSLTSASSSTATDAAAAVYAAALAIMPTCSVLALAAADHHELRKRGKESTAVYVSVLEQLHVVADKKGIRAVAPPPSAAASGAAESAPSSSQQSQRGGYNAFDGYDNFRDSSSTSGNRQGSNKRNRRDDDDDDDGDGDRFDEFGRLLPPKPKKQVPPPPPEVYRTIDAIDAAPTNPDGSLQTPALTLLATAEDGDKAIASIPLVYVLQQRAARRVDGIDAARAVFAAARKSPYCTSLIYLASAHLEYYSNRDLRVSRNIIEAGRKKYSSDITFLISAIDFLSSVDDSTNMRAFFESTLQGVNPADSRVIWDRFIAYEIEHAQGGGSLQSIALLEQRRAAVHQHLAGLDSRLLLRLVHRYSPYGSLPASRLDDDLVRRHPVAPFASLPAAQPSGRENTAEAPPSYDSALVATLGRETMQKQKQREGLYLQALHGLSTPLSHIPVREALRRGYDDGVADVKAWVEPMVEKTKKEQQSMTGEREQMGKDRDEWRARERDMRTSISRLERELREATHALGVAQAAVVDAQLSSSAAAAAAAAKAREEASRPGPGGQLPSATAQGRFVDVPLFLRPILARLPCFDLQAPSLTMDADAIVQKLRSFNASNDGSNAAPPADDASTPASAGEAEVGSEVAGDNGSATSADGNGGDGSDAVGADAVGTGSEVGNAAGNDDASAGPAVADDESQPDPKRQRVDE